jgi:hypothetical protein
MIIFVKVELQRKIQSSNMLNQARLKALKSREDHVQTVLTEARQSLVSIAKDQQKYPKILEGLIGQVFVDIKIFASMSGFKNSNTFFSGPVPTFGIQRDGSVSSGSFLVD